MPFVHRVAGAITLHVLHTLHTGLLRRPAIKQRLHDWRPRRKRQSCRRWDSAGLARDRTAPPQCGGGTAASSLSTRLYYGRIRRREVRGADRASATQPRPAQGEQGEAFSSQDTFSGHPMVTRPCPSQ